MSMFDVSRVSVDVGDSQISFETGKLAKQAGGAVVVQAGDTMVLCTATLGSLRDVDFLPLTVDIEERMYAAGKIPGSFFRREGKSGEKATLTARMIDRPIRPLFPSGWHYETQLVAMPLSVDHLNPYDILAMNGASAALAISEVPVAKHVGAVRVGKLEGDFVVNPPEERHEELELDLIVAGTDEAILMVEAGADGVSEAEILDALDIAHGEIKKLVAAIEELRQKAGKEKIAHEEPQLDESLLSEVRSSHGQALVDAIATEGKLERYEAIDKVKDEVVAQYAADRRGRRPGAPRSRPPSARSRRTRSARRSPSTRSAPTAAPRTRSGRSSARSTSPRACTARRSSPAARPRSSPTWPWERRGWTCGSTRSACRRPNASSITTTSRPSRSARPASCAARSGVTSVTALSPSAPWRRRSRTKRSSRT